MASNKVTGVHILARMVPVTASRNHQGRRGTTVDIGDNLLPSLTIFGCSLTADLKSKSVPSLMLLSQLFFSLVLRLVRSFYRGHFIQPHTCNTAYKLNREFLICLRHCLCHNRCTKASQSNNECYNANVTRNSCYGVFSAPTKLYTVPCS